MSTRFLFDVIAPSCLLFWAALLLYSAAFSDSGYRALQGLEEDVETAAGELDAIRARRMALEKRADLLNSRSLDPDLVDERIRSILGYAREGDVVISRSDLHEALKSAPGAGR
ncbi:MAG: FtsB family cell division protein [Hyphococcus sp.]